MNTKELEIIANHIRKNIVLMLNKAQSGHSGGAIGLADVFSVLYFYILKHNPKRPNWKQRDYVFLSNGHVCPVLYATLAQANYFKETELFTLRRLGSKLQGHPHKNSIVGIENSSGPLGQGLSQAIGLASSFKRENKHNKVFCFVGDGELEEGQIWEANLFAVKEKLNNFIQIIDRNYIQIDGRTEDVSNLDSVKDKYLAFNWEVVEFDGNSVEEIIYAFIQAIDSKNNKPKCLIARTVPGKNISFMENDYKWHGKAPNDEETKIALKQLNIIERHILEK